jgi:hypothetical protein
MSGVGRSLTTWSGGAAVYAGMTPPIEFDPSALWEVVGEIRRAFETGERIAVLVDGEVLTGTVSVTIGWASGIPAHAHLARASDRATFWARMLWCSHRAGMASTTSSGHPAARRSPLRSFDPRCPRERLRLPRGGAAHRRLTIESGGNGTMPTDLPREASAYTMAGIYEATVHSRGAGYGWGIEVDRDRFWIAVRANLRETAAEPEFRIIIRLLHEPRGRAYMGCGGPGSARAARCSASTCNVRGLGSTPLYSRADADALIIELRKYLRVRHPST